MIGKESLNSKRKNLVEEIKKRVNDVSNNSKMNIVNDLIKSLSKSKLFIIGNYSQQISTFIFTFFIAKQVDPEQYGIVGLIMLMELYFRIFNLGSNLALNKQLSINKADFKALKYWLISVVFYVTLVTLSLVILYYTNRLPILTPYIVVIGAYYGINYLLQSNMGILRAYDEVNSLGMNYLFGTIVTVAITLYYMTNEVPNSPTPLLQRMLLVAAAQLVASQVSIKKLKIDWKGVVGSKLTFDYLKYMMKEGLSFSAYIFSSDFYSTLDRQLIAYFFGTQELGLYTFALQLVKPIQLLLDSLMYLDFARYLKEYYETMDFQVFTTKSNHFKHKYAILLLILAIPFAGVSYFVIENYFIKYSGSYYITLLVLLFTYVKIENFSLSTFLISTSRYKLLIGSLVVVSLIYLITAYIMLLLISNFYLLIALNILITGIILNYFLKKKISDYFKIEN